MKNTLAAAAVCLSFLALPVTAQAGRDTLIWNAAENQVAVLKGPSQRLGPDYVVVHPTKKWTGLGRYQVVMPKSALRPRASPLVVLGVLHTHLCSESTEAHAVSGGPAGVTAMARDAAARPARPRSARRRRKAREAEEARRAGRGPPRAGN